MKFSTTALLCSLLLAAVHADDQPIASELDGLGPPPPSGFGGKFQILTFFVSQDTSVCTCVV